jgi:hypothetical protein
LRNFLLLAFAGIVQITSAQAQPAERNAARDEIIGIWQLSPLPESVQPKGFQNPWPAPCQWFSYTADGVLKTFETFPGPCQSESAQERSAAFAVVPAVISWEYDLSPVYNKALIIIRRSDVKGYAEYWEPHYVTRTFNAGGAEIKQGDLLLYLVKMGVKPQIVWIRHLTRVQ